MITNKSWLTFLIAVAAFAVVLGGCSASDDGNGGDDGGIVNPPLENTATCEGCHTSEEMLKATVEDDGPPPESEGEG